MPEAALELRNLDEAVLIALAQRLAPAVREGGALYLVGELGAGKTTFARALLHALGIGERIKSPTYSLIESYRVGELAVHHVDFYRIADPGELPWLGLAELSGGASLLVVEWPERGAAALPPADLVVELAHASSGRDLRAHAGSLRGQAWLRSMRGTSERG